MVAVLTCTIVSLGYGRHSWDISPANFPQVALYGSVAGTLTIVGSACSKTSFALTLLRLPIGWMNYLVWAMIVSLNVLMALSAVSVWFECRGPSDGPQSCLPVDRALTFAMFTGGQYRRPPSRRRSVLLSDHLSLQHTRPLATSRWPFCRGRFSGT